MNEDMRGLFFIVKGQYRKGAGDSVVNRVTGDTMYLGGYDPEDPETPEWYMCMDRERYIPFCCGSDYNKVLNSVRKTIARYKTRDKYFRMVRSLSQTTQSPIMVEHYKRVEEEFGDYFNDDIERMEDLAFGDVRNSDPVLRARKRSKLKKKTPVVVQDTPKEVQEVVTPKKTLRKKGLKVKTRHLSLDLV